MARQQEKWGAAAISMVCFVALTSVGIGLVNSGPVSRYEEDNPFARQMMNEDNRYEEENSFNTAPKQIENDDPNYLIAKNILKKTPIIDGYFWHHKYCTS